MTRKPVIHVLKTQCEIWEAIKSGEKTFEVRKNDCCFQRGDIIHLEKLKKGSLTYTEWESYGEKTKTIIKRIGWMLQGGQFGIDPGYCAFTLEDVEET